MFSLRFYPEFDSYHAAFRLQRMRNIFKDAKPVESYRIADFFLCHPFELARIRMPPGTKSHLLLAEAYAPRRPYRYSSSPEHVTLQMWPFQQVALQALAVRGVLSPTALAAGRVHYVHEASMPSAERLVDKSNEEDKPLLAFLDGLVGKFEVTGPKGLKARTGLLDYRYDVRRDGIPS